MRRATHAVRPYAPDGPAIISADAAVAPAFTALSKQPGLHHLLKSVPLCSPISQVDGREWALQLNITVQEPQLGPPFALEPLEALAKRPSPERNCSITVSRTAKPQHWAKIAESLACVSMRVHSGGAGSTGGPMQVDLVCRAMGPTAVGVLQGLDLASRPSHPNRKHHAAPHLRQLSLAQCGRPQWLQQQQHQRQQHRTTEWQQQQEQRSGVAAQPDVAHAALPMPHMRMQQVQQPRLGAQAASQIPQVLAVLPAHTPAAVLSQERTSCSRPMLLQGAAHDPAAPAAKQQLQRPQLHAVQVLQVPQQMQQQEGQQHARLQQQEEERQHGLLRATEHVSHACPQQQQEQAPQPAHTSICQVHEQQAGSASVSDTESGGSLRSLLAGLKQEEGGQQQGGLSLGHGLASGMQTQGQESSFSSGLWSSSSSSGNIGADADVLDAAASGGPGHSEPLQGQVMVLSAEQQAEQAQQPQEDLMQEVAEQEQHTGAPMQLQGAAQVQVQAQPCSQASPHKRPLAVVATEVLGVGVGTGEQGSPGQAELQPPSAAKRMRGTLGAQAAAVRGSGCSGPVLGLASPEQAGQEGAEPAGGCAGEATSESSKGAGQGRSQQVQMQGQGVGEVQEEQALALVPEGCASHSRGQAGGKAEGENRPGMEEGAGEVALREQQLQVLALAPATQDGAPLVQALPPAVAATAGPLTACTGAALQGVGTGAASATYPLPVGADVLMHHWEAGKRSWVLVMLLKSVQAMLSGQVPSEQVMQVVRRARQDCEAFLPAYAVAEVCWSEGQRGMAAQELMEVVGLH